MLKLGNEFKEEIKKIIKETTKEEILWSGSSNTVITLSDSILNYEYIIVYFTALSRKWSININGNGNWGATVSNAGYHDSAYALRTQGICFSVNGTIITPGTVGSSYATDVTSTRAVKFFDNVGNATITKVVGYNKQN